MNISDTYQPNQLKPFSAGSSDPYVTAGFSYDNLPKTFVVGDGGTYKLDNTNYINQPLKANTPYILFVRFIETEVLFVIFISTMLCDWLLACCPRTIRRQSHWSRQTMSYSHQITSYPRHYVRSCQTRDIHVRSRQMTCLCVLLCSKNHANVLR